MLPRRRLIPRWRPVAHTLLIAESSSLIQQNKSHLLPDSEALDKSIAEWRKTPTAGHLGDVLAFAVHDELVPGVLNLAKNAIASGHQVTAVQTALIGSLHTGKGLASPGVNYASPDGISPFQTRVRELRKLLTIAPGNVLSLLDFAQLQLAAGNERAAERTIRTALALQPNNRVVLRTAARFLVHTGNPDRAHSLIARAAKKANDPWLIASEIALSDLAGRESTSLQRGRRLLKDQAFGPKHIAELAGAITTVELIAGQTKAARDSLRMALLQPNDNVIAQALIEQSGIGVRLDTPELRYMIEMSSEAKLFEAWNAQDEVSAEAQALAWHAEEPFSSRPIQFLTTLYSLRGNHALAERWVQAGLRADPRDPGLLTNLAFTQAALGRFGDAERAIRRVRSLSSALHGSFVTATEGLIALKRGAFEAADTYYRSAIEELTKRGRHDLAALCLGHYAKRALEVAHPDAEKLFKEAIEAIQKHPSYDAQLLFKSDLEAVPNQGEDPNLRRLSQLILDTETNTLTHKIGLTARGAPGFLIKKSKNNS